MATEEKARALRELAAVAERLHGLRLRVLAGADDVALEHGARVSGAQAAVIGHALEELPAGGLLRGWHHHRAHDPTYTKERMPNDDIRFHRRR